jgi:hypothetical protein
MANEVAANPWEIDTAGVTVLANFHVKIGTVIWKGYTAGTDDVVITDKEGNTVFEANGRADLDPISEYLGAWVNGLIVPTLDAGKVLIFLE